MSLFGKLISQGHAVMESVSAAKEAYSAWQKAVADAAPTLAETDLATLQAKLEAVHAVSMEMSQELDAAIQAARR